jgi:hypothetical protein
MAKGLNYERRMKLANRFSKPAPKATSYNRFGSGVRDRELDTPTKILGGAANLLLPSPSMIKQAVQDPSGTVRGAAELVSLGDPIANTMRGINLVRGKGFSLYDTDMSDVEQAAELAGLFPGSKAVSAPLKAAARVAPRVGRVAEDIALSPVGMLLGTSGAGGGNIARATRQASDARDKVDAPDDFETNLLRGFEETKVSPRYTPPEVEARLLEEAKTSTPLNNDALVPKQIINGDWETVEISAQNPLFDLTKFDPSEIRLLAFGGIGDLAKDTPLAGLGSLKVPENATTIRAIYAPPTADEVLTMMKKTDAGVQSRPYMLPGTWKKNKYTIEDAQALLDRWKVVANKFEKTNERPLPWRLEADVPDPETGVLKTKRIFGQDVEHAIPVNQGGTGAAEELVLLPSIPNMGKGDLTWEEYAGKYPEEWTSLVGSFYGDVKRY